MEFIAISDEVLVNPEMISIIEKRKNGLVVHVDGKQYVVDKDIGELLSKLIQHGLADVKQFFRG